MHFARVCWQRSKSRALSASPRPQTSAGRSFVAARDRRAGEVVKRLLYRSLGRISGLRPLMGAGYGPRQAFAGGAHLGWGAADPPEVAGGGTTFGSCTLGAPFSMAGSTSFGWMIPFELIELLAQILSGRSRLGGRRRLSWRGVGRRGGSRRCNGRLDEWCAGDKGSAGDQEIKPWFDPHALLNATMRGPFHGAWDCEGRLEKILRRHAHSHRSRLPRSRLDAASRYPSTNCSNKRLTVSGCSC